MEGENAASPGPVIRPVRAGDYDAWRVLWDGYNAFYGRRGTTALPESVTEVTWSRFFMDDEPMHALVAENASRVLGIAHYLFHRTTTQIAPTCYMQDLFTAEEARGLGIGRALITSVCERARRAGSAWVYWQTQETNTRARRLYDQLTEPSGFIVYRLAC